MGEDLVVIFHGQVLGHVGDMVLGLTPVESGEGKYVARSIPIVVDQHKDLVPLLIFHFQDQPAEGGTIVGGMGQGEVQLDKVLGVGPAEAARNVTLMVVCGEEGVTFVLGGVVMEHVHQSERKVGIGREGGEAEDGPNHGLGFGI